MWYHVYFRNILSNSSTTRISSFKNPATIRENESDENIDIEINFKKGEYIILSSFIAFQTDLYLKKKILVGENLHNLSKMLKTMHANNDHANPNSVGCLFLTEPFVKPKKSTVK
jgi:hypothetical protein